jgi:putative oxygen-independent coproporphyrinogen III oxidase
VIGSGLYVHVPFCLRRCPYCGFAAEAGRERELPRYVEAVVAELRLRRDELDGRPLASVFLGGGTPSLLAPAQVSAILEAARGGSGLRADVEISLEANPGTAAGQRFAAYRRVGVNRLSLGVQSLDDRVLCWLGRLHCADDARRAFAAARAAGFDNINLDLMFRIPEMSVSSWEQTLDEVVALGPEHVSAYALTVEAGTDLAARVASGAVTEVDEHRDAAAYESAVARLESAGYSRYEVSNFACVQHRCRHNWSCWHGGEYLGIGAAAHSFVAGVRSWNVTTIAEYVAAVEAGRSARAGQERIDCRTALRERVWMRLRTHGGLRLDEDELDLLTGAARFRLLVEAGLVELCGDHLVLGRAGWLVADGVGIEITALLEDD